jgi:hypothetical protein
MSDLAAPPDPSPRSPRPPRAMRPFGKLAEFRGFELRPLHFYLLAALLLALAYWVLKPTPPRRLVLATGVSQGAYADFGQRYAQALQRHGITVELRETQGAAASA